MEPKAYVHIQRFFSVLYKASMYAATTDSLTVFVKQPARLAL